MTQTSCNATHLDDALVAIRAALACMDRAPQPAPPADPVASPASCAPVAARPPGGATPAECRAEQIAVHHYLAAASLLLDASLKLLGQPPQRSSFERSRQWSMVIQQTKTAGRMVYGGALALADPQAPVAPPPVATPRA